MAHVSTLMGQLLQLIPRHVFDDLVHSHAWQGPNPQKFTYGSHLGAMLLGHQTTDNHCYSVSVPDSSDLLCEGPWTYETFLTLNYIRILTY
jgi:hypothetical protein